MPSVLTGSFFIVDTADAKSPKLHKVVEGKEITAKTGLVHTTPCIRSRPLTLTRADIPPHLALPGFRRVDGQLHG